MHLQCDNHANRSVSTQDDGRKPTFSAETSLYIIKLPGCQSVYIPSLVPGCLNPLTSDLQFAYKQNHSTSMCTLTLKEVVKYYTSRQGQVYCCLLDASKAFDRVRFDKLFIISQT